jgi:ubiquinone/menaquinone biosynthesis C-methylase UbiE
MTSSNPPPGRPEFSGLKGRFFAWFLTSPLRRVLDWKMGNPDARAIELLQLDGTERVVDSGCGSGYHTLMVARRLGRGRVVGVDVSTEMLGRLRRTAAREGLSGRIEAIEADALALPLADESFDRAITVATWHHLVDPRRACRELVRVLRRGGRLVAIDLSIGEGRQSGKHLGHARAFSVTEMRSYLEGEALRDIHVEMLGRWVIGSAVK